jgi:mediator of RNA polymerase II transcription subunit 6
MDPSLAGGLGADKQLHLSWNNSAWIPFLTQSNVMEYFCQTSNPFYDRTCNNEIIKMQRQDPSQLQNMKGIEYSLLHVQEPVLYVIRKNYRQAPDKISPMANYYVLGGTVYQCPDLKSVLNSRLLSTLHLIDSAFDQMYSYAKYHPARGHYWDFPSELGDTDLPQNSEQQKLSQKQEPSDAQCKRVEVLLNKLVEKYPYRMMAGKDGGKPVAGVCVCSACSASLLEL